MPVRFTFVATDAGPSLLGSCLWGNTRPSGCAGIGGIFQPALGPGFGVGWKMPLRIG